MEQEIKSLNDDINNIPLADEDAPEVESDDEPEKLNSVMSTFSHDPSFESICSNVNEIDSFSRGLHSLDSDLSSDQIEEKKRLIQQVIELQNTLDDLSLRVDSVKAENLKLKSENQVLGQYIENLMSASSVFQSTSPKNTKKKNKR